MADVLLKNVVLSFPKLFQAERVNGGDPRYSANFIFEEGSGAHQVIVNEIAKVTKEKWADKPPKGLKNCVHDGDEKDYAGYEGNLFVSAGSKHRPQVVDRNRSPISADDNVIYPGCVVNALVNVWPQDNSYGKRVNAELVAVQFVKDGTPLGGRAPVKVADVFDEIDDSDWEDDIPF